MPDWFYRTVTRPSLFKLSAGTARSLALGFMGRLGRLPFGGKLIDLLGHMRPDPRLAIEKHSLTLATRTGLGPLLDRHCQALPALARFGFGWINLGPVSLIKSVTPDVVSRQEACEGLTFTNPFANDGLDALLPKLLEAKTLKQPLLVGLVPAPGDQEKVTQECQQLLNAVAEHVDIVTLQTWFAASSQQWSIDDWSLHLQAVISHRQGEKQPILLLGLSVDADLERARPVIELAMHHGFAGVHVNGLQLAEGGWQAGKPCLQAASQLVKQLRTLLGQPAMIIAAGGVHDPVDALRLKQLGADLIEVDTGLIYTGPGLNKRINEALLYQVQQRTPALTDPAMRPVETTWFWLLLMGWGMLLGSVLALIFAATTVILPYDETFLGRTREELNAINPRILSFMAHDRVTLAGAMIALGILYVGLAWHGIRAGHHWAKVSVMVSAIVGFASFFLFLGFGYLDPLHAMVSLVLLQFLLMGVIGKQRQVVEPIPPDLTTDTAWLQSLWGQLLLLLHAGALIGAGMVISGIGVTQVFVQEDLMFMQTTAETLRAADRRLVPLIAHDRATLGGMLLASGIVFLLPVLWGYRRSRSWLWWTMLAAGAAAYVAAIGVHYLVGYTHWFHLFPAYLGAAVFLLGMALSFPYLGIRHPQNEAAWREWL